MLRGSPTNRGFRWRSSTAALWIGSKTGFASAIAAIADAPPGCVVVACHAGEDRTGVVIALALHLLGVSDQVIAEDYAAHGDEHATEESPPRERVSEVGSELQPLQSETILAALDHLRSQYGSIRSYLAAGPSRPIGSWSGPRGTVSPDIIFSATPSSQARLADRR